MHADRIAFISAYCDRWCERCAFTTRCSAYAVHAALTMCDGDFAAAIELAVGASPDSDQAGRQGFDKYLAEYHPTERELAEVGREIDEREERIDESPLTTDALVASTLSHQWLSAHSNWFSNPPQNPLSSWVWRSKQLPRHRRRSRCVSRSTARGNAPGSTPIVFTSVGPAATRHARRSAGSDPRGWCGAP